ncbi:glycosyltransferase [Psychroserpens sp. Hel_I_66]|uniref:glycosyltransferase n=1 Tax=Psychroserpens sp. Hel_I_66 TaxID=1250004 RepID=UPI00064737D4|nr:glycosyltransferase [Psychroserpens sp. Hel_I_66]
MLKTLHIILLFGHPDQPYTKITLESLNVAGSKVSHEVLCSKVIESSQSIKTHVFNSKRDFFNFKVLYFIVRNIFFDKKYGSISGQTSLKAKLNFFLKWETLLNHNFDVVHVHHLHVVPDVVLEYLRNKHVKLVTSLRGKDLISDTVKDVNRLNFLQKIEFFDIVHVISDYMYELAIKKGIDKSKLKRIYRGYDFELLLHKNLATKKKSRDKHHIKAISVGRLVWAKGHFYTLDSIYRLKKKGVFVSLDIYGEGREREFLEYRIHQLGLDDLVLLKGHIDPIVLKEEYKDYDIAIQASIYEALSNGLLDLTFHNIPSVISRVGGMTEIIEDGVNGVTFNIKEPFGLDNAIIKALDLDFETLKAYNEKLREKFLIENELLSLNLLYTEL